MTAPRLLQGSVWIAVVIAFGAGLTSCGGGSDAPAASTMTISGAAAKGAMLAGAAVTIKCVSGSATATTGADGRYTATISGASLPCALKAVGTDGSTFHSLVPATGNTGSHTANISPLTEMLVAQVAAATPAAFYSAFGSGSTLPSAADVTKGLAYLQSALDPVTKLGGINVLTDALAVGNALDQRIEAVMAALAGSGVTLDQVVTAIAGNPAAPTVLSTPLAPKASTCAWLRSGRYRIVNPYESDPALRTALFELDAVALTVNRNGVAVALTDNGACQYSITEADGFVTKLMVSSSGVLVAYGKYPDGSQRSAGVGLPEQTLPLAEFAGTWNIAGWRPSSSTLTPGYVAQTDEVVLNASGQVTAVRSCLGLAACAVEGGPFPTIAVNAGNGGFDSSVGGLNPARVFLFKTLAGKSVFVVIGDDGQFLVGARKEAIGTLPAVGTVSNYREFDLLGNGSIGSLAERATTVTAVDPVAKTVTRIRTPDNRVDTLAFDRPRDGLRYRAPSSCTVNGVQSNCAETVQLPLQGMGITLALSVGTTSSTAFYSVSINRPAN